MKLAWLVVAACGAAPPQSAIESPPASWPVPAGWRAETIAFPLDFAPTLAHRGVEVIRFAPGFFDPKSAGYWSYAFAWRLDDAAQLDATALSAELTTYFRGLVTAVDDKHRIPSLDPIVVRVSSKLVIDATVIDAFTTAQPVRLMGTAQRHGCGDGALWIFVLQPVDKPPISEQLNALASAATCDTVRR